MTDHLDEFYNPLNDPVFSDDNLSETAVTAGPTSATPSRPASLTHKQASTDKPTRKGQAQQQYVTAVTNTHVRLAEIEQNAQARELEFEER